MPNQFDGRLLLRYFRAKSSFFLASGNLFVKFFIHILRLYVCLDVFSQRFYLYFLYAITQNYV